MTEGHDGPDNTSASDIRRDLDEIRRALDSARVERAQLRDQIETAIDAVDAISDEIEQTAALKSKLAATSDNLRRLHGRKSVKVALRFASLIEPVIRLRRRAPRLIPDAIRRRAEARRERTVVREIRAIRNAPTRTSGPLVSIIVPTRDGAHHLRRLLIGLRDRTAYQNFELVVVDNGSTDDTPEVLSAAGDLKIVRIANPDNVSFSHACNQGANTARGDLLLFLNNDTDPINPNWLGAMVEAVESNEKVAAAGALLIYPPAKEADSSNSLAVQHRGIAFAWVNGAPRPANLGIGEDPTDPALAGTVNVAAATAACLLVRRTNFEAAGGFDESFTYGWEDVDLCLRLRAAGGQVVMAGGAALFHHEFGTQESLESGVRRVNYLHNSQTFTERWAPAVSRAMRQDELDGTGFWSMNARRKAAITVSNNDPAAGFGDWYTAHELGDELERLGWHVSYAEALHDHWYHLPEDVTLLISLLPDYDLTRGPSGAYKVAWIRNWADRWTSNPTFGEYDLALVATTHFGDHLDRRACVDNAVFPLATNPDRFHPGSPSLELQADYTFPGNHWGGGRRIFDALDVAPDETFTIFGTGWDRYPRAQRYWRGPLPYERLPALYSSVPVVLDSTTSANMPALNARVFDALAAGTLVLTDNVEGSREFFDGELPTYSDRRTLRTQLDRFLTDPSLRTETVARLRAEVLARHTYRHRATELLDVVTATVSKPRVGIRIGPPAADVAEQWGDTHFARRFAKALRRRGYTARISLLPDWDAPRHQDVDIVVHLRGLTPYVPKPAHMNVLWLISHPEDVPDDELERFDLVLVASEPYAKALAERLTVPVYPLLQATDPQIFHQTEPSDDLRSDLLFVGNTRGHDRPGVTWAAETGLPLTVYGSGWDGRIPRRMHAGDYFRNDRLNELYASAGVVLNDHWDDMRRHGFISNRIFDALASGALVVTDPVEGLTSIFGDTVPTYSNAQELRRVVDQVLGDDEERKRRVDRARRIVLDDHTFDRRAETFEQLVTSLERTNAYTLDARMPMER